MFHKAVDVKFKENTLVEVTFQSGEVKVFDMSNLFEKYPQLKELKKREIFLGGKLVGAYGIVWNDELDIEVETIYEEGTTVRKITVPSCNIAAEAVLKARARAEISQVELSKLSGIDQSDISKIERGVANPSINTLIRLANAMGMKLEVTIS